MALSDTKLRAIHNKPYDGKSEITDIDGLSVRVSPKGVITFQCRYRLNGKQNRIGIGRYPAISLRDARTRAAEIKIAVDGGIDPSNLKVESSKKVTVYDCIQYWEDTYVNKSLRQKTQELYRSTVIKNMKNAFSGRDVSEISSREWMLLFSKEEDINPRRARQLFTQLKSAINWCIRRQFIDDCNLMKISPRDVGEKARIGSRVLTYTELAAIWKAIERSRAATSNKLLHQMIMLWGCRISELRLSTISEFNLNEKVWSVPEQHSKTGKIIRRPIFPSIEPLLDKALITYGEILFPGQNINKPMTIAAANRYVKRLNGSMGIDDWRAHDFRRTIATRLSEEGVAPHVIEKMLGHEMAGIMAVYNKHDWISEQKDAYEIHADKLFWHIKNSAD